MLDTGAPRPPAEEHSGTPLARQYLCASPRVPTHRVVSEVQALHCSGRLPVTRLASKSLHTGQAPHTSDRPAPTAQHQPALHIPSSPSDEALSLLAMGALRPPARQHSHIPLAIRQCPCASPHMPTHSLISEVFVQVLHCSGRLPVKLHDKSLHTGQASHTSDRPAPTAQQQ